MTAVISPRFPTQRPPKPAHDKLDNPQAKEGLKGSHGQAEAIPTAARRAAGAPPPPARVPPENGPVINGKRPGRLRALPRSTNVVQMRDDTLPPRAKSFSRRVGRGSSSHGTTFRYWYRTET